MTAKTKRLYRATKKVAHANRTLFLPKRVAAGCLTARERQMAGLVAQDLTNDEIAELLEVTPHTVKVTIRGIMNKLTAAGAPVRTRVGVAVWYTQFVEVHENFGGHSTTTAGGRVKMTDKGSLTSAPPVGR